MNSIMLHTHNRNRSLATFKLYQDRWGLGDVVHPVLGIRTGDVDLTIFPSYEQLRELHILIGQFMLDHPEAYERVEEVVNAD